MIFYDSDCTERLKLSENDSSESFNRDYFRGSGSRCFDILLSEGCRDFRMHLPPVFSGLVYLCPVNSSAVQYSGTADSRSKGQRNQRKEKGEKARKPKNQGIGGIESEI